MSHGCELERLCRPIHFSRISEKWSSNAIQWWACLAVFWYVIDMMLGRLYVLSMPVDPLLPFSEFWQSVFLEATYETNLARIEILPCFASVVRYHLYADVHEGCK